jgi:pyruvate,water dikinase
MVRDEAYDPEASYAIARERRETAMTGIEALLGKDSIEYWQFRYRLWFSSKYYPIREEAVFWLGSCWPALRPLALELGRRFVSDGTLAAPDRIFYLLPTEIEAAIAARASGAAPRVFVERTEDRFVLREARKRVHPPGLVPPGAEEGSMAGRATQVLTNDENSEVLNGFAVSPGVVVGVASLVVDAQHFSDMMPNTILVCPMTSPAWTQVIPPSAAVIQHSSTNAAAPTAQRCAQLFAHATGLVTDMGSILAHGSIVAREYGIPAVLGVGSGTQRIKSGDVIAVDGDGGTVTILDEEAQAAAAAAGVWEPAA